jgi:hypothetical protein
MLKVMTPSVIILIVIKLSVMLHYLRNKFHYIKCIYAKYHHIVRLIYYAKCRHAKCRHAKCRGAKTYLRLP